MYHNMILCETFEGTNIAMYCQDIFHDLVTFVISSFFSDLVTFVLHYSPPMPLLLKFVLQLTKLVQQRK